MTFRPDTTLNFNNLHLLKTIQTIQTQQRKITVVVFCIKIFCYLILFKRADCYNQLHNFFDDYLLLG